jgi:phosphoglycerate dehydrogenase-like enzyme
MIDAGVEPVSNYNAVLSEMDAVAIHCMKTPETTNMFSLNNLKR